MTLGESFSLAMDKGGLVMGVLMALSVYTMAIILLKSYQFYMGRVASDQVADNVINLLENGQVMRAMDTARLSPSPLGRVLHAIMDVLRDPRLSPPKRHAEIQRVGNAHIRDLERYMRGLDLAANVGPLLGLLGTVAGMVTAFSTLENAGSRVDPALLAGGIWEALLTTVAGLVIAIPAMAAHYMFDSQIEAFRANLKDATTRLLVFDAVIASARGRQHEAPAAQQQPQQQPQRHAAEAQRAQHAVPQGERPQQTPAATHGQHPRQAQAARPPAPAYRREAPIQGVAPAPDTFADEHHQPERPDSDRHAPRARRRGESA